MDLHDLAFLSVQQCLGDRQLYRYLPFPGVCLMRTHNSVSHGLVVGDIQEFHLRKRLHRIGLHL